MNHLEEGTTPQIEDFSILHETTIPPAFDQLSDSELTAYLKEYFPEITSQVWHQLTALNQHSIERVIALHDPTVAETRKKEILAKTHLSYELNMARAVLAHATKIEQ